MNFFEGQDLARRNTKLLVVMYVLAVAAVILAVDLVLATSWIYGLGDIRVPRGVKPSYFSLLQMVPGWIYGGGALVTAGVIFSVSGWEVLQLAAGGQKVAEMVGARRVSPETRDPLERRLQNVVEEMAIASGVRLPKVYVMDQERGINAFAAGYDISDSVVAVTRGTLETLNRDELQAVVGHEFSHILNGDMRLNIRMMGVLAGIVFIGAIGEFFMRVSRDSDSKQAAPVFLFGLALFVIGYIGLFFARLIKAAVSRQREFLADASSVQFTRNPDGIAGALAQIDASMRGTLIADRRAEDMSHMFFGQSIQVWFGGLFDTHPPIPDRIERAHPRFDIADYMKRRAAYRPPAGKGEEVEGTAIGTDFGASAASGAAAMAGFAGAGGAVAAPNGRRGADAGQEWGRSAKESVAVVGALDAGKLDYARQLLAGLPPALKSRVGDAEGASGVILALMLAPKAEVAEAQLAAAAAAGPAAAKVVALARELAPAARRLGPAFHLPLIDLALPALKSSADATREALVAALQAVVHADRRVSLHEFVVLTMGRTQLLSSRKPAKLGKRRLAELKAEAGTVLAIVAHAGTRADAAGEREEQLRAAIAAGAAEMGIAPPASVGELSVGAAGAALEALRELAPMQKALLVKGLFATVSHDGTIRVAEAELMRLAGAVLECPLPPLLTELDPATLAA